jgi:hypothetical protein
MRSRGLQDPRHGPRRDLPGGGKEIPWQPGARPRELVYFATPDHRPPKGGPVLVVCEGEKAADAVAEAGYAAAATVCGAPSDPSDAVVELLAGYPVILAPDADEQGRRHMARLSARLERAGIEALFVVDPPDDAPKGWDLADVDVHERRALIERARPLPLIEPDVLADIHSGEGDGPVAGMHFPTARELFATVPEQAVWILAGLVPDGALTELDGAAKRAGKTWLLAHLVRAVLDGTPFLGRTTRRGPVVYLSEQPPTSLRQAFAAAGLVEREDVLVLPWSSARGHRWHDVATAAAAACVEVGAVLLVVDTLPQWAGLRGDAENDAGAALEAIAPLQAAAAEGLAVIVVRHDRRAGGDVGDSARGSTAFGGAVDVILQLRRGGPDERDGIRHLAALSRFPETPAELVIEYSPDAGYAVLGDGPGYAKAEGKAKILEAIADGELRRADVEGRDGRQRRTTDRAARRAGRRRVPRAGRSGGQR